jgi:signal transduction histidine kinase
MVNTIAVVLALGVAGGYFALATIVLPKIEVADATPGFVRAFRIGGVAFFAGCGLTHTHIAAHALADGSLIGWHELVFHFSQVIGVWVFVYVAVKTIDVRVQRRLSSPERMQVQIENLSRSNVDLEQFAAVVSHDLKGPLHTVSGFAELLERDDERLGATGRQHLAYIKAGCVEMQGLLDGVLSYSRAAGGGLHPEPVDLGGILDEVLASLSAEIDATGATVTVGSLPEVTGDRLQLRQLLKNLVANALKFTDGEPPRIEITSFLEDETWRIQVRDHGIGIPPEDRERVFAMLGRGRNSTHRPGTGIGLAICRKIAERHGGELTAQAGDPDGAVLSLTLPASAEAGSAPAGDGAVRAVAH